MHQPPDRPQITAKCRRSPIRWNDLRDLGVFGQQRSRRVTPVAQELRRLIAAINPLDRFQGALEVEMHVGRDRHIDLWHDVLERLLPERSGGACRF